MAVREGAHANLVFCITFVSFCMCAGKLCLTLQIPEVTWKTKETHVKIMKKTLHVILTSDIIECHVYLKHAMPKWNNITMDFWLFSAIIGITRAIINIFSCFKVLKFHKYWCLNKIIIQINARGEGILSILLHNIKKFRFAPWVKKGRCLSLNMSKPSSLHRNVNCWLSNQIWFQYCGLFRTHKMYGGAHSFVNSYSPFCSVHSRL